MSAITLTGRRSARRRSVAHGEVNDSLTVAGWTAISRVTGFVRVIVVAAVLGPTVLGNTYQFTNSLPNLIYYGFLAGALFSSVLVPALVQHIDTGDVEAIRRLAGSLLGLTSLALLVLLPFAFLATPQLLALTSGASGSSAQGSRLLAALLLPQVLLYCLIGTATAVQNAHRRFRLAAAAPALENLGTIAALLLFRAEYAGLGSSTHVPVKALLLLGAGSTAAVAVHASVQWYGALRCGIALRPRAGWRESQMRALLAKVGPSLAQTGAGAILLIALLLFANRVLGGVIAVQIGLNFYFLPVAIAATPVALALSPRLARLPESHAEVSDMLLRGLRLAEFLTLPVVAGYLAVPGALASVVAAGRMDSPQGVALVTGSIRGFALGVVGEGLLLLATYACFALGDFRSPMWAVGLQALVALPIVATSLLVPGHSVTLVIGLAHSAGALVGAIFLWRRLLRGKVRGRVVLSSLLPSVGAAALSGAAAWGAVRAISARQPDAHILILIGAIVAAGAVYLVAQAAFGSEEVGWLLDVRPSWPGPRLSDLRVPLAVPYTVVGAAAAVVMCVAMERQPKLTVIGLLAAGIIVAVALRPEVAGYLLVLSTPLIVGISRGKLVPALRPSEAVLVLAGSGLCLRGILRARSGALARWRLDAVERAFVGMALCNSLLPLVWMELRGAHPTTDDLLYALVLWKFFLLYLVIRHSITTERHVGTAVRLMIASGCVVSIVAVLQSLHLFGVPSLLATYYAPDGSTAALNLSRGSSLLSLPAAVGDLAIITLALSIGLIRRGGGKERMVLVLAALISLGGVVAAAEFSSLIALVVGGLALAAATGSRRVVSLGAPATGVAAVVMWPVWQTRLMGFQGASGLPTSWIVRLSNLRTYFWPNLFSHGHWLLGVRTAARVPVPSQEFGYVWIESGYTWLLWAGGIPLLLSYLWFVGASLKQGWSVRLSTGPVGAAGVAVVVAFVAQLVSMVFDPHLTYRGSGDALFALLAMSRVATSGRKEDAQ